MISLSSLPHVLLRAVIPLAHTMQIQQPFDHT